MSAARRAVVVGVSSGIGAALASTLVARDWSVVGTVRSAAPAGLDHLAAVVENCDLADSRSVDRAAVGIVTAVDEWDALIVTPGTLEPVGVLADVDPDEWAASIQVNLVNQVRLVQRLLPAAARGSEVGPCVLFFAGGGSNSAPIGFSAYTVAKIALTKFAELLDAEEPDLRVAILGPGWVRTRIHEQTLASAAAPQGAREETLRRLESDDFVPMSQVMDAILWAIDSPKSVLGGRNIAVASDPLRNHAFVHGLDRDANLLKLRRHGNDHSWMGVP